MSEPKTVAKAFRLLDLIARQPGRPLTEISQLSGVSLTTAHRLLGSLVAEGFVRVDGDKGYHLGVRCLILGNSYLEHLDFRAEARPFLEGIVAETGETTHLGILDGVAVVYIDKVETPHPVRMYSRVGATSSAYCTGLGKAILAYESDATVQAVIDHGLRRRTPHTIVDPDLLRAELDLVRARGYAIDDIENEEGIRCVAAAIRGPDRRPLGAISVAAPAARFSLADAERVSASLVRATGELSRRFGFPRGSTDE